MYKVMIVDDEPLSIKGIQKIIEASSLELQVIGTARSGRKAIECAYELHPDILITDIKMPGINGLSMIRTIKERVMSLRTIIISAFDYFEYANEAASLGVDHYLLKPVPSEKLTLALEKCIEAIKDSHDKVRIDLKLREDIELMYPLIEDGFISAIRCFDYMDKDLSSYSRAINGEVIGGYALSVTSDELNTKNYDDLTKKEIYTLCAENIKLNCVSAADHVVVGNAGSRIIIFIFTDQYTDITKQKRLAENMLYNLTNIIGSENIQIGIGNYYEQGNQYKISYQESVKALRLTGAEVSKVVHINDIKDTFIAHPTSNELVELIYGDIAIGDFDLAIINFEVWFAEINLAPNSSLDLVKGRVLTFLSGFSRYDGAVDHRVYALFANILHTSERHRLKAITIDTLMYFSQRIPSLKNAKTRDVILKANQYMTENYAADITLDIIANAVNLSPFYFSRLYKEETGENFSTKLIEIRINAAKHRLETSDISIKELAISVGYNDANYFSKLFKKSTGYAPTEYKARFNSL